MIEALVAEVLERELTFDLDPLGTIDCSVCTGAGRLHTGAKLDRMSALEYLGDGEEECDACDGKGLQPKSPKERDAGFASSLAREDAPQDPSRSFWLGYHQGSRQRRRTTGGSWLMKQI